MSEDTVLNAEELNEALKDLPGWEVREGWLAAGRAQPGNASNRSAATVGHAVAGARPALKGEARPWG